MPKAHHRHLLHTQKSRMLDSCLVAQSAGSARTLDGVPAGVTGVVCRLLGGRGLASRLLALGFTPGAEVTVVQNRGRGPIIVVVREVRVALGRGAAQKIEVAVR